ncbi:hypothetical protein ES708_12234 [subsurface metagenome]
MVIRASAIPGATVSIPAEPSNPILRKAFRIPQTVPRSPKKGLRVVVVARTTREPSRKQSSLTAPISKRFLISSISVREIFSLSSFNCEERVSQPF